MKKFLKRICKKIGHFKNSTKWKAQRPPGSMKINGAQPIEDAVDEGKKILIIVPHPDDELIGCDSIISKYRERVTVFYSGMLGSDYSEQNRLTRTREFEDYCKQLNVDYYVNCGDIQSGINRLLKDSSFGYIFIPTIVDWHNEHRELFKISTDTIRNEHPDVRVFCYQVTVPFPPKYITHYSEMTQSEQREKWNRFRRVYVSQRFMPIQRFKTVEKSYSPKGQMIIAEVFMELKGSFDTDNYVCGIEKKEINNLAAILKSANGEYERIFGK